MKFKSCFGVFALEVLNGSLNLYKANFYSWGYNNKGLTSSLDKDVCIIQTIDAKYYRLKHNSYSKKIANKDILVNIIKDYTRLAAEIVNKRKLYHHEIEGVIERYNNWKKEQQ